MTAILSVAAWNVQRLGSNKVQRVADASLALGADVLLFSEWKPTNPVDLGTVLADAGYPHQATAHWSRWEERGRGTDFDPMAWGVLAASRWPIIDVSPEPPSDAPGSWLEVDLPAFGIRVIGCRVLAYESPGKAQKYAKYFAWMLDQCRRLDGDRALIAGDLNGHLDGARPTQGLAAIVEEGWVDAVGSLHRPPPKSFYRADSTGRNDFCLLSPMLAPALQSAGHPVQAGEYRLCGPGGLSDHAPVEATLRLNNARLDLSEPGGDTEVGL